jgi:hypothetical protein
VKTSTARRVVGSPQAAVMRSNDGKLARPIHIFHRITTVCCNCTRSHVAIDGQNDANDPNQTSISTRKRDTLRSHWVSNLTGESRNDGAKKCSEVGHWRDHMRRRRKPRQSSLFRGSDASLHVVSWPNAQECRRAEPARDESGEAV